MKDLFPIQCCRECGSPFWAGLPTVGLFPTYVGTGTKFERQFMTVGFTWKPGWMDHCSKKCADADLGRNPGPSLTR